MAPCFRAVVGCHGRASSTRANRECPIRPGRSNHAAAAAATGNGSLAAWHASGPSLRAAASTLDDAYSQPTAIDPAELERGFARRRVSARAKLYPANRLPPLQPWGGGFPSGSPGARHHGRIGMSAVIHAKSATWTVDIFDREDVLSRAPSQPMLAAVPWPLKSGAGSTSPPPMPWPLVQTPAPAGRHDQPPHHLQIQSQRMFPGRACASMPIACRWPKRNCTGCPRSGGHSGNRIFFFSGTDSRPTPAVPRNRPVGCAGIFKCPPMALKAMPQCLSRKGAMIVSKASLRSFGPPLLRPDAQRGHGGNCGRLPLDVPSSSTSTTARGLRNGWCLFRPERLPWRLVSPDPRHGRWFTTTGLPGHHEASGAWSTWDEFRPMAE